MAEDEDANIISKMEKKKADPEKKRLNNYTKYAVGGESKEVPAQTDLDENDNLTQNYLEWREKGMNNKYAVRYPVGYKFRNKCLFSLKTLDGPRLDYIDARKQIYLPLYLELVKNCPQFLELKGRLANGENLLIIEVDGPHQESLNYYKSKYGVNDDFIISNTIVVNKENMNVMLNDPKHSFGHGYCLGIALFENLIKDS